jgi:pimeloyl-ACP methyl ester carboxylesterase
MHEGSPVSSLDPALFSTEQFLKARWHAIAPKLAFRARSREEWLAWQAALRAKTRELLRLPDEAPAPLNPRTLETVQDDGFRREKVVFDTMADFSVPAWLLIPDDAGNEQRPAILALHGHPFGKSAVVGLPETEDQRTRGRAYNDDYARQFARRGYVVLAPDARGFGELGGGRNTCQWLARNAFLLGYTLKGLRVHDAFRALDYLQSRPEVDPERVGCVGLSWGGAHTAYTTALDPRIKAAVVSGLFSTYGDIFLERDNCICHYVPDMLQWSEYTDVVGLIAPRPLLLEVGDQDPLLTPAVVDAEYARLQEVYRQAGMPDNVAIDRFDGRHQWHGTVAYAWMDRVLGGAPTRRGPC